MCQEQQAAASEEGAGWVTGEAPLCNWLRASEAADKSLALTYKPINSHKRLKQQLIFLNREKY